MLCAMTFCVGSHPQLDNPQQGPSCPGRSSGCKPRCVLLSSDSSSWLWVVGCALVSLCHHGTWLTENNSFTHQTPWFFAAGWSCNCIEIHCRHTHHHHEQAQGAADCELLYYYCCCMLDTNTAWWQAPCKQWFAMCWYLPTGQHGLLQDWSFATGRCECWCQLRPFTPRWMCAVVVLQGGLPTFLDVGQSFSASAISEDNLLQQLLAKGKRLVRLRCQHMVTAAGDAWGVALHTHIHIWQGAVCCSFHNNTASFDKDVAQC